MIATQELSYEKHKTQIKEVLLQEQNYFCAYTDDRISPAFAKDIEHFNPTLKTTDSDNYHNWFMVSHEWNMHKGTKNAISRWLAHQPLLLITDDSLESRILYDGGYYFLDKTGDVEAENLLKYLLINDLGLPEERQNYIKSLKDMGFNKEKLEQYLINNPIAVRFPRAIETEFNIKL